MNYKIINLNDCKVDNWSGGFTRQLFIYPSSAQYAKRNFGIRISSATIETDSSEFTYLPGFVRYLTVLDGEISLNHDGGTAVNLHPGMVHQFSGEMKTFSFGKATDFNLMLSADFEAKFDFHSVLAKKSINIVAESYDDFLFLFVINGYATLILSEQLVSINDNDFVEISGNNKLDLFLLSNSDCKFLLISVKRK